MNHITHLTDNQIERYVQQGNDLSGAGPFKAHLTECESCRSRLLEAEREQLGLRTSGMRNASRSADCPPEEDLQAFAAGVGPPWILEHAAECDYCAPLLQEYLGAFEENLEPDLNPDPEPSPSRHVIREGGKTTGNRIPKKIFLGFKKASERLHFLPGYAKASLAGAGVLLACIPLVPTALNAYNLNKGEKAIAAVAQEAPLKIRLGWGAHPHPTVLKDPMKPPSPVDNPLLALAAQLASKNQNSADPRWLRLRGRVKFILGEYEDAAKLLQMATDRLNDPDTEIDLAVADFERAQQPASTGTPPNQGDASADDEKNSVYLRESFELLARVLRNPKLTPNQRATATFDLAMVYERMESWDYAVLTWEKYLELDPAGAWHNDAQNNLEEAKKHISLPKPQGYRSPDFFLQHSSDSEVLDSLEEYVDIALREWLPEIDGKESDKASLAFVKLGQLMHDRHRDPWVRDFLQARRGRDQPALIALSKAVSNNKIGWYGEARRQAQEAENLFATIQHRPGQLRARFEAVYANQRLLLQNSCQKSASTLNESVLHTQYQWLRAQAAMELAACLNFAHKKQNAQEQIAEAQQIATASSFPILSLRVQGWNAGIGGCDSAWNKVQHGLAHYWQGPSFPLRLYDFYSFLKLCSQTEHHWYAAELLQRRMIMILEQEIDRKDANIALEATAHGSLGQILKQLDEPEEAADEARIALQLTARMEPDLVVKYSSQIKFQLADLQLDRDDGEAAWVTIREVEDEVRKTGNDQLLLPFLRIRGDVNLRKHLLFDAEVDYKQGIEIAESAILTGQNEGQLNKIMGETGDLYRGLVQVYMQQKREQEALQLWEWYQAHSSGAGDTLGITGPPKWPEIERSVLNQPVPDGATPRLVYVSTRDKLLVWAFGISGTKTAELPVKREGLQRRIREYLAKIGREQRPELPLPAPEAESKELFALLLQPVLADLPRHDPAPNPIVFDFDPAMSGLSVEALMSPEGWYFGQRYPVVYSPGFIRGNQLRQYSRQAPTTGLAINALGDQDAVAIFKEFIPQAVIVNEQDGRPEERAMLLAQSEIFLFAGHGKSGALLLANGKPLTAKDFPQASLANMQLAVLMACSSGVAKEGLLDTGGLIHAFQAGGTPAVIASQWNVATDFTEQFIDRFFSNMKKGAPPTQALFEARKQLFHMKPHPYYWAAFTLSGRA